MKKDIFIESINELNSRLSMKNNELYFNKKHLEVLINHSKNDDHKNEYYTQGLKYAIEFFKIETNNIEDEINSMKSFKKLMDKFIKKASN